MSYDPDNQEQLPWSGERYVPQVPGNIRLEHVHRYLLARQSCAGRRVLDIACGEGYGSALLAEVADRVIGVDIAPDAVAHARRCYARPNLKFTVGDCVAIPLPDASVDVVVSFETIEHHDQHDAMLREIKRVLSAGGTLIISSPDKREYSDVPAYSNPFHVRELYRDELEHLLGTYFRHVSLVGQRIKAGSLTWPLGDATPGPFTGFETSDDNDVRPLGPPLYLIAVASDEPVRPLPPGVLDGGAFVWFTDHVNASQAEQSRHAEQVRLLSESYAQAEAQHVNASQAEQSRHAEQVRLLSESYAQAEAQAVARATASQAALEASQVALAASQAALAASQAALDARQTSLDASLLRVAALEAEVGQLTRDVEALAAERSELQEAVRVADQQLADASREQLRLIEHVRLIESSHSWRVTAPLRALRREMDRGKPQIRTLRQAGVGAYRALPLSVESRLKFKGALFRSLPFVFRRTSTYQAWDAYRRTTEPPPAPASPETSADAAGALPNWFYADIQHDYVPIAASGDVDTRIKAIAFYLPQFHPIPENDLWWGKGFTEWTNVSRGKPQFAGHYQPHLPGELGFYDLRVPGVQRRQIELAKMYGLHGFCYHHYWFGGRRLLRQPLDQLLANSDMNFPFCLCWANENWTRRWDGQESDILIGQQHSPDDDLAFIKDIEPALRDRRYVRVGGRPVLVVYRPALLPDARATAQRWRQYCRDAGLGEIFLINTHSFDRIEPGELGFDAAMEFSPNNLGSPTGPELAARNPDFQGTIYDYRYLLEHSRTYQVPPYVLFRSVTPMWDNEARRPGRGTVFAHASPACYQETLENACRYTDQHLDRELPFVFINAWNEWAEGAHLEPDARYGYAYLQATADALRKFPTHQPPVIAGGE